MGFQGEKSKISRISWLKILSVVGRLSRQEFYAKAVGQGEQAGQGDEGEGEDADDDHTQLSDYPFHGLIGSCLLLPAGLMPNDPAVGLDHQACIRAR